MDLNELKIATNWHSALRRAEDHLDAFAEFKVVGIVVDRGEGGLNPIRLERGCAGGGSISSLGWPDDLAMIMTAALHQYLEDRAKQAREALTSLGVKVEAA